MQFTDGLWRDKEGWQISWPRQKYEVQTDRNRITMYGPFTQVIHRGNTLNNGMMTVELQGVREDVICVRMSHHMGERKPEPVFETEWEELSDTVSEDGENIILQAGELCARVLHDQNWGITFWHKDRYLTGSAGKSMAYIVGPDRQSYVREQLELDAGELVYGLGERFTAFIRNGQSIDMWNADGGTDSPLAYKNVPFYISSKGYGVFVNHPERVSFEVAAEVVGKCQFSVPGERLEYYIIGGNTLKDVIRNYTALTGRPPLVPAWSFGLWLTTSFTTDYNEEVVLRFIDGMRDRNIPLSVFHFDCFWMKEFEWCNFKWDERVFHDPKGLLEKIHARGIRVCVWINPYIAQKSPLYAEGSENGYFVKTGNGEIWQWDNWQAGMALVDFTNPEAVRWYQSYLEKLCDMGVDAFKTDFGERIPVPEHFYGEKACRYGISYFDGSDAWRMHNYYTFLYNRAVYEVLEKKYGERRACLFARSATAGSQKYPVHWGGDSLSSYASMAESLRGGLSLSLCGFGYWSHDIGGFEAGCTPDIYMRWTQFGLLSSHSRYHGNSEYKVPWLYGEEAVRVTRRFARLKNRLMPYLFSQAVAASREGLPMMHPLLLEFENDPVARHIDMEYLLGSGLLVAPIMNEHGVAEYYLPEGNWVNLLTGEKRDGRAYYRENYGYDALPLMIRENAVIAMGSREDCAEYDYAEHMTVGIGFVTDGAEIRTEVFDADGSPGAVIKVSRNGELLSVCLSDESAVYDLFLFGAERVEEYTQGSMEKLESGILIRNVRGTLGIVIHECMTSDEKTGTCPKKERGILDTFHENGKCY